MLDLYLILIPAVLIVFLLGLWVIRGMSARAKFMGKLITTVIALSLAGIITVAFISSIVGLIIIVGSIGYYIWKKRYAH